MRFKPDTLQACLRWLPALFFATLIFLFSATPAKQLANTYNTLNATVTQAVSPANPQTPVFSKAIDWLKVGHFIGYFCLGAAVLFARASYLRRAAYIALALCSLYAVTDEFHQTFTPGRSASGWDILLDSLAALAGILFLLLLVKWSKQNGTLAKVFND